MLAYPHLRKSLVSILLFTLFLGGCATSSPAAGNEGTETAAVDPWEPLNRRIFRFNQDVDRLTLKPVATRYEEVIPSVVRRGVSNFYSNLRGPRNIVNNFLQGKALSGLSETGRFVVNSTLGLGGIVDVASDMGLERHREDFGQTLAVWGVPDGPFVMVPFAGPQTLRDVFAFPVDVLADPVWYHDHASVRYPVYALRFIDIRAGLLATDDLLEDTFDPYIRLREAYLQNRRYAVYDGDPPVDDDFYDDMYDDFPEPEPAPDDEQD